MFFSGPDTLDTLPGSAPVGDMHPCPPLGYTPLVMMWCVVSVDARLDVNVALNRPAYQSSTFVSAISGIHFYANLANDGNSINTRLSDHSCAHTDPEMNPWWAVDLGVALYIAGVRFTNRGELRGTQRL